MENTPKRTAGITIEVESASIDDAIEKANRLVELLREAATLIDSLSAGLRLEP